MPAAIRTWWRNAARASARARTLAAVAEGTIRGEEALRRLVREAAEDDASEGSRWLELQVDPTSYAGPVGGITPALEIILDEAAAADAAIADGLAMGQEVGAKDGPGSTYTVANFEAWEQRCVRTESGVDPCQLYLLLKDKDGNSVAEFTIFNLPKGTEGPAVAGATFIAPLETFLPGGMTLQIDDGKGKAVAKLRAVAQR